MAGADTLANQLINSLTNEADFTIPKVDLSGPEWQIPGGANSPIYTAVKPLTEADLTSRDVGGTGLFDGLMAAFNAQIAEQFEKGRITADDYTKAYIAMSDTAMGNAVQFLMNKDQAFWAAQMAQTQAIMARVSLETAKVQLQTARLEALNQRANFALTKLRLATESNQYDQGVFQLGTIMPKQAQKLDGEVAGQLVENQTASYNLSNILPKQAEKIQAEVDGQSQANLTAIYNLNNILPNQNAKLALEVTGVTIANDIALYNKVSMLPAQLQTVLQQRLLLNEQTEAARAQTTDGRSDGIAVTGVLGKQKDLYNQQIASYKSDADTKAIKIFSDAWITQKTIDEGVLPPNSFTNGPLETMLSQYKARNGF